jgi:hypothetical protein
MLAFSKTNGQMTAERPDSNISGLTNYLSHYGKMLLFFVGWILCLKFLAK